MKAAWDWHLPRSTTEEERSLISFAHEVGFDTLIIHRPTQTMMDFAHTLGMKVLAILTPNATDGFVQKHPDAIQQMLPAEVAIADATRSLDWEPYTIRAHRWFLIVQMTDLLCFEHPAAQQELEHRVSEALTVADGVAFDGFGFLNHYACFCGRCRATREAALQREEAEDALGHREEVIARMSEETLVQISHKLYAHAKRINPDAIVTNHLWPPFRPNPYYGNRLKLDYCSQTISWFYKPNWSLARVEFEAQEMKRLEDPSANRFVPFIGMFADPYLVRSAERVAKEIDIAKRYGEGHLIFCNLKVLRDYPQLGDAVKGGLAK